MKKFNLFGFEIVFTKLGLISKDKTTVPPVIMERMTPPTEWEMLDEEDRLGFQLSGEKAMGIMTDQITSRRKQIKVLETEIEQFRKRKEAIRSGMRRVQRRKNGKKIS